MPPRPTTNSESIYLGQHTSCIFQRVSYNGLSICPIYGRKLRGHGFRCLGFITWVKIRFREMHTRFQKRVEHDVALVQASGSEEAGCYRNCGGSLPQFPWFTFRGSFSRSAVSLLRPFSQRLETWRRVVARAISCFGMPSLAEIRTLL